MNHYNCSATNIDLVMESLNKSIPCEYDKENYYCIVVYMLHNHVNLKVFVYVLWCLSTPQLTLVLYEALYGTFSPSPFAIADRADRDL